MAIAALVISVLSLAVAAFAVFLTDRRAKENASLSEESLRVAQEALADSRQAKVDGLWSAAIEDVLRLIGVDPSTQSVQEPLQNFRVSWVALLDGLPDWHGLDKWMAIQHALGAVLGRQVIETAKPGVTIEEHFEVLKPFIDWGSTYSHNLRHLRSIGYDAAAIEGLRSDAEAAARAVYARNGWALPSGLND